jgi:hypothetical protein
LGTNPKLSPEGIYGTGPKSSGLGLAIKDGHITDLAGNMPLNTKPYDIEFMDDKPPEIVAFSLKDEVVNRNPVIFLRIKDENQGFDSGINLEETAFKLDGKNYSGPITTPSPSEYLADGTHIDRIVELEPSAPQAPSRIMISNQADETSDKEFVLKAIFKQPISEGTHKFEVIVTDRKRNKYSRSVIFKVALEGPEGPTVIDLATYPNPFAIEQEEAVIRYVLTQDTDVEIRIYDVAGRMVRQFRGERGKSGVNDNIKWDGKTRAGEKVSAGIYICELIAGEEHVYWRIAVRPPRK